MVSTELVGDISEVQGTRYKRVSEAMINIGMLGMQELFFCWGGGDIVVLMEYYVS